MTELIKARAIAEQLIEDLSPYCEHIEIAGSIRREKPDVGDIELVAIPIMLPTYDMFRQQNGQHSLLDDRQLLGHFGKIVKAGQKFVQLELWQGINLDLFIVTPPARWGVIYTIRTGPADFSHWLVTPRAKGGALHTGYRVADGSVYSQRGQELPFDDELDFLDWIGLGWIEPKNRKAEWGKVLA